MDLRDIQEELFRLEYPYLHAGSDPDIERYCYLRGAGQGRAALAIYQLRIRPRYPDDSLRMALLRSYRCMDPLFPRLLAVGYRRLAERALERVRGIIDYISKRIEGYNRQDVYSTIKTIEDILRFFPREQYEAVSGIDRMYRYAQVLKYHVVPMEQAAELVRAYLSQSLPILDDERERRRRDQRRIRRETAGATPVDFSTVAFSDTDLTRIEIPDRFTRVEDQTLAYCMKYWNLIHDAAFEQILFLYSRKYGKKNHAVYLTIRRGRNANYRDEDILSSVMSMLVTGYYYSIQGDRYLQQGWRSIKNTIDRAFKAAAPPSAPLKAAPLPALKTAPPKAAAPKPPAGGSLPKAGASKTTALKTAAPQAAPPKTAASGPPPPRVTAPKKAAPLAALKTAPPKAAAPKPPAGGPLPKAGVSKTAALKTAAPNITAPKPAPPKAAAAAPGLPARKPPLFGAKASPSQQVPPRPAGGSVSDRLRKLSGRGYDLYQDRFFAHARPAIRKILGAGRGIFFSLPEKAEDLVYHYLRDHYADPYMNWAESEEHRQLAEDGFNLPSLDPVIDECFKKIK
jgi:hypothetical protein